MSLFSEIFARLDDGSDSAAIADRMVVDLKLSARQREALFGLILAECDRMERAVVRSIERTVGRMDRPGRRVDIAAERADLLTRTFAAGKGRRVTWGEATIADHEERLALLAAMRNGIASTMARHAQAIELLRSTGAACLNDLDPSEVLAA